MNATVIYRPHHINDFTLETKVKETAIALRVFVFCRLRKEGLLDPFSNLMIAISYATIEVDTPIALQIESLNTIEKSNHQAFRMLFNRIMVTTASPSRTTLSS